jgi:hypothetical protein
MRRTLIWLALGTFVVLLADWEESPEWRQWRARKCAQAFARLDRRTNSTGRTDGSPDLNDTTKLDSERLREQLRALEQALRCLNM